MISEDRAAKGRGHGRKEDGAGAGERDAGRAAADPRRSAHRGGRSPGPKLLPLRRATSSSAGSLGGSSTHTQRAYRQDVMDFVRFLGLRWPDESTRLFTVSVADVLAFRDQMLAESKAPKTINRRIASLSSFYKYLQGVASEFRLPITVPNPAHAQFIPRGSSDPRDETKALSATRARQLMGLPSGDTVFDYRDRAIIKFFLYSGARIGTACRLRVKDFHQDGDEATVTLHEKGDKHRRRIRAYEPRHKPYLASCLPYLTSSSEGAGK